MPDNPTPSPPEELEEPGLPDDLTYEPTGRFADLLGPLRNRDYRLFVFGGAGIGAGVWIHLTTIGWLANELTDADFLVALINVAWFVPFFIFALPSGVIADRFPRWRVLLVIHSFAVAVLVAHATFDFLDVINYPLLVVLTLAMGSTVALELPARQSFIAMIVTPKELVSAMALNATNGGLMRFLGPLIAGFMLDSLGAGAAFTTYAITEVFFIILLLQIRSARGKPEPAPDATDQNPVQELVEGLRYIREHKDTLALVLLSILTGVVGWVYVALMPVVAEDVLDGGAVTFGLLSTSVGVGGLPGALYLAAKRDLGKPARWMVFMVILWGFGVIAFALSSWIISSMLVLVVVGFAFTAQSVLGPAVLLQVVEPRYHGRVFGVLSLTWGANIFGTLVLGVVSDVFGVQVAVGGSGIMILLFTAAVVAYHPKLLKM